MLSQPGFFDKVRLALDNLFNPDNPFVPWMLIFDLALLLLHIYMVYWVYRDALARYRRGAPWAVLAAVFPVGGWLFYVLYRKSPLVELDRLDTELFDEAEQDWTDYDTYQANQSAQMFRELSALWRKPEGQGYSPWVRLSRLREQKRGGTPEERAVLKQERLQKRKESVEQKRQRREELAQRKRSAQQQKRERTTLAGTMGTKYRMSDRKQRALQRKLEVVEKLKLMPREDHGLEEMIYEMRYAEALQAAHGGLAVAQEMRDPQGVITYEAYIERLQRLVEE
jgi:hypothetical protein